MAIYDYRTCPWCFRNSYNTHDIDHEYCPCCGSVLLPKDCKHRPKLTDEEYRNLLLTNCGELGVDTAKPRSPGA